VAFRLAPGLACEHMFRPANGVTSPGNRFTARLRRALALPEDALVEAVADSHPHRRPLGWERQRRPGRVAARIQPCLSPVRPARARKERQRVR